MEEIKVRKRKDTFAKKLIDWHLTQTIFGLLIY